MVTRKLDGALDESSADQEIRKPVLKIWRPAPSGTGFYGKQAGSLAV